MIEKFFNSMEGEEFKYILSVFYTSPKIDIDDTVVNTLIQIYSRYCGMSSTNGKVNSDLMKLAIALEIMINRPGECDITKLESLGISQAELDVINTVGLILTHRRDGNMRGLKPLKEHFKIITGDENGDLYSEDALASVEFAIANYAGATVRDSNINNPVKLLIGRAALNILTQSPNFTKVITQINDISNFMIEQAQGDMWYVGELLNEVSSKWPQ